MKQEERKTRAKQKDEDLYSSRHKVQAAKALNQIKTPIYMTNFHISKKKQDKIKEAVRKKTRLNWIDNTELTETVQSKVSDIRDTKGKL